jgi:hypothetical protein
LLLVMQLPNMLFTHCASAVAAAAAQFVLLVGTIGLAVYAATQVFGWNAVLLGQRGAFSGGEHCRGALHRTGCLVQLSSQWVAICAFLQRPMLIGCMVSADAERSLQMQLLSLVAIPSTLCVECAVVSAT